MSKLLIVVPRSRAYCGRAVLVGAEGKPRFGPVRVLATASSRVGRRHGNPACDPLRPFGHPPAGTYTLSTSLPPGYTHPRRPVRFGSTGALLLAPRAGDALASVANGRGVFAVHGGPLDAANRLRPTRGGLRLSDADLNLLFRAMNEAHREDDPLETIEVLEGADEDIRSVQPSDLRGARRAVGAARGARGGRGGASAISKGTFLMLLGAGAASHAGKRKVDRREMLQTALLLVGGLTATACSQPSPCTPLACDPADPARAARAFGGAGDGGPAEGGAGDGGPRGDAGAGDGGPGDAASDASPDGAAGSSGSSGSSSGSSGSSSGGSGGGPVGGSSGSAPAPCPPQGYACEEDNSGYVVGGGVG